jgi:aminoglycoside phosphotransferase (APT) family kinase protein
MSYHQLLVDGSRVTAILDWQEAGCGDYLIDISRLIYSLHDRPWLVKPVLKQLSKEDLPKLKLFTAFHILDYLYWPAEHSPEKVEAAFNKAKSAFEFVFESNLFLAD